MSTVSTPSLKQVARAKQALRERVWALLERERVARFPGANGRIPNFVGAPAAAARLAALPGWRAARVLKANPDAPQLAVRARALADGKLLYMAVPRLVYRLVTSILDPEAAPAAELALLYHERWELEGVLDELKTHQRGAQVVLRSRPLSWSSRRSGRTCWSTTPFAS